LRGQAVGAREVRRPQEERWQEGKGAAKGKSQASEEEKKPKGKAADGKGKSRISDEDERPEGKAAEKGKQASDEQKRLRGKVGAKDGAKGKFRAAEDEQRLGKGKSRVSEEKGPEERVGVKDKPRVAEQDKRPVERPIGKGKSRPGGVRWVPKSSAENVLESTGEMTPSATD
jgi:hypothetical protein